MKILKKRHLVWISILMLVMFVGYYSQRLTALLTKTVSSSMSNGDMNSLPQHYMSPDIPDREGLAVCGSPDVDHTPPVIPDKVTLVLIVGYMRSGTSLIGELFKLNDNVFYMFEPLWIPANIIVPGRQPYYHKGKIRSCIPADHADDYYREVMRCIFQCNLSDLDIRISLHDPNKIIHAIQSSRDFKKDNISRISESCNSKEIRVVKEIHMRLNSTWDLLKQYHNLHVVHLMRDPRAILKSRLDAGECYQSRPYLTTITVCGDMIRDLEAFVMLKQHFPTRVHRIFYETMALDIIKNVEVLYSDLHLHLTLESKRLIASKLITSEATEDQNLFGTKRIDSAKTASRWRSSIDWQLVDDVQSYCRTVFEKTQYKMMKSLTQIRNLNISLV